MNVTTPQIIWFWEVLEEMSNQDRVLFIRFVSGRSRLAKSAREFRGLKFEIQVKIIVILLFFFNFSHFFGISLFSQPLLTLFYMTRDRRTLVIQNKVSSYLFWVSNINLLTIVSLFQAALVCDSCFVNPFFSHFFLGLPHFLTPCTSILPPFFPA
jgi:Ubiquitin-protein ligase